MDNERIVFFVNLSRELPNNIIHFIALLNLPFWRRDLISQYNTCWCPTPDEIKWWHHWGTNTRSEWLWVITTISLAYGHANGYALWLIWKYKFAYYYLVLRLIICNCTASGSSAHCWETWGGAGIFICSCNFYIWWFVCTCGDCHRIITRYW